MKHTFNKLILIAILSLATFGAHAGQPGNNGGGNGGCGNGQQTNGCGTPVAGDSTSQAAALGIGLGVSGSESSSKATGGEAFAGSHSMSSANQAATNGDMTLDQGNAYVAPAGTATSAPRASGCIKTDSHAGGIGWNAAHYSQTKQSSDVPCAGMQLADKLDAQCQYLSASIVRQRVSAALFPSYAELPAQPGVRNLTPAECTVSRK